MRTRFVAPSTPSVMRLPLVLVRNLFALLAYAWSALWYVVGYLFRRNKKLYIAADLESDYRFGPPSGLARYMREKPSFLELRETFQRLADSDDVEGLVVATNGAAMGHASADALGAQLDHVREAGKRVVTHVRAPTTTEYLLATAGDEILMTPAGRLYTFGPRLDQFFAADALERLGAAAQIVHIGRYKTASHRMIHREMTAPQAAMMRTLRESLVEEFERRIDERRNLDDGASQLFANAPMDAARARRMGFADAGVFRGRLPVWLADGDESTPVGEAPPRPEMREVARGERDPEEIPAPQTADEEELQTEVAEQEDLLMVDLDNASGVLPPKLDWEPLLASSPSFAVLDLSGMIVMPDVQVPGGAPVIDPDQVLPALQQIRQNPSCAGLLLHVNSPGGSALASDIVWEAIERTRQLMPVVAYCTDVAGSGGYYLAASADEIVMHPTSVTGSIGVVTGKFTAPDLLDRIGVNVESIYEHDADTFTSLVHPLSDDMLDRMNEGAREFYRTFLQRVGRSRDLPRRRLHRYARGRVYTGREAERRNLADGLGDFEEALRTLSDHAGVPLEEASVDFVPHREQDLRGMLGLSASAAAADVAPDELVDAALAARLLQREQILALMPFDVDWTSTPVEE